MPIETSLSFPRDEYVSWLRELYSDLNGPGSLQPEQPWQGDVWSARTLCSRGDVLEKAGICRMHLSGGTIEGTPASLSFLETIAYPQNPELPGFIIMTNLNQKEALGQTLVFYCDLIFQNSAPPPADAGLFSREIRKACEIHGHDFDELNAFAKGQGIMGGTAGECGFLYFFEEKDVPFIDAVIRHLLGAYRQIITTGKGRPVRPSSHEQMHPSRRRLIEWIIMEDYGIKIGRENGVPLQVIEAYAFPPVIQY